MRDRMVSFSMTWSDTDPGFKVTVYLLIEYLKTVRFRDKDIFLSISV